jgi:hypothetical protein
MRAVEQRRTGCSAIAGQGDELGSLHRSFSRSCPRSCNRFVAVSSLASRSSTTSSGERTSAWTAAGRRPRGGAIGLEQLRDRGRSDSLAGALDRALQSRGKRLARWGERSGALHPGLSIGCSRRKRIASEVNRVRAWPTMRDRAMRWSQAKPVRQRHARVTANSLLMHHRASRVSNSPAKARCARVTEYGIRGMQRALTIRRNS